MSNELRIVDDLENDEEGGIAFIRFIQKSGKETMASARAEPGTGTLVSLYVEDGSYGLNSTDEGAETSEQWMEFDIDEATALRDFLDKVIYYEENGYPVER